MSWGRLFRLMLCVGPCFLVLIALYFNVMRYSIQSLIQRRNALALRDTPYKADMQPMNKRIHMILVAYFRSGSTFTGSMFDANDDMFYSFEPLHPIQKFSFKGQITMSYLNGTERQISTSLARRETIENILQCRLSKLSIRVLKATFWEIPRSSKTYWQCRKHPRTTLRNCVTAFEELCLKKGVIVIKTIRFQMEEIHDMLNRDNSLKVVHLVRDPRPSLYSIQRWGFIKHSLQERAAEYCSRIYNDTLVERHLFKYHAGKVKLVFYEDITVKTKIVVKDIYEFVGLPFTAEIEEHIKKLGAQDNSNCFLCLERTNASYQLYKWRIMMPLKDVQVIDSKCGMLYDMLGYKPARSEILLRDLTYPLRVSQKIEA